MLEFSMLETREYFLTKKAANDRMQELRSLGYNPHMYKGHRSYVVQCEMKEGDNKNV